MKIGLRFYTYLKKHVKAKGKVVPMLKEGLKVKKHEGLGSILSLGH
jgi:hypothetical protein